MASSKEDDEEIKKKTSDVIVDVQSLWKKATRVPKAGCLFNRIGPYDSPMARARAFWKTVKTLTRGLRLDQLTHIVGIKGLPLNEPFTAKVHLVFRDGQGKVTLFHVKWTLDDAVHLRPLVTKEGRVYPIAARITPRIEDHIEHYHGPHLSVSPLMRAVLIVGGASEGLWNDMITGPAARIKYDTMPLRFNAIIFEVQLAHATSITGWREYSTNPLGMFFVVPPAVEDGCVWEQMGLRTYADYQKFSKLIQSANRLRDKEASIAASIPSRSTKKLERAPEVTDSSSSSDSDEEEHKSKSVLAATTPMTDDA